MSKWKWWFTLLAALAIAFTGCKQPADNAGEKAGEEGGESGEEESGEKPEAEGNPAEDDSEDGGEGAAETAADKIGPANTPPLFEVPAWHRVGVGQTIGFGLEFIDPDTDEMSIELIEKPESAAYDPYTLTVVWTPSADDAPQAEFVARVTETIRATGEKRVFDHGFAIDVLPDPQPEPVAQSLSPEVELLITIHDEERLAKVNENWPIDKMLEHGAAAVRATLPEEEQAKIKAPTGEEMYVSLMKEHAMLHDNPALDPESEEFDAESFGDPKSWKIIAVRPRLDKAWHEVRIVYRAKKAPQATYVMFKWRPTAADSKTEEQRAFNNKTFGQLTLDHFFTGEGDLDMALWKDKAKHAEQVDKFVTSILTYENDEHDWARGTFLGLPAEARLGGGSMKDDSGKYVSGDGWSWYVFKAKPKDDHMAYKSVVIKGFATNVEESEDGKSWKMACAPKFDPDSDPHDPRFTTLCRDSGHVDMPATEAGMTDAYVDTDGEVVGAKVDAANLFVDYKKKDMVKNLALRDPRRDLFEEKGMTCYQCHVRDFGVRDMYDKAAYDPSAGLPKRLNKQQDVTFFVITPTDRWRPYALDFQHKQECKFAANIEKYVGVKTSLDCPLMAE